MKITSRSMLFAAPMLLASTLAFAQSGNGPAGSGSVAPTPPPQNQSQNMAAGNPHQPGATGSTVVPGNTSTMSSDHKATVEQKTGQTTH